MNKERFQAALNYIGDDLIAEAADYKPKARSSIKAKPKGVIKIAGAFVCAAAVLAGAVGLRSWYNTKFGGVSIVNTPNDSISAIIDEINKSKNESDISFVIDKIDQITKDSESSPGKRFSPVYGKGDPTLDFWKDFDSVIWYTSDVAHEAGNKTDSDSEDAFSRDVKPGSVKTSALLYNLITTDYDSAPIFAVRVWFDPCINEAEMDAWKYKGLTIQEIREMMYDLHDEKTASELSELLDDAEYDYYLVQMQRFYEKDFEPQNLDIYPIEKGSTIKGYKWFYCFMRAQQVAALTCKSDEAFYLDLAFKNTN